MGSLAWDRPWPMPSSLDHIDDYDLGDRPWEEGQSQIPYMFFHHNSSDENQSIHDMLLFIVSSPLSARGLALMMRL
jgi:hypothetical protein